MTSTPPGPRRLGPIERFQAGVFSSVTELQRWRARYGDTFRLPYRGGAMTYVGAPEAAGAIYTAPRDTFSVWGVDVTRPVFGRRSVVVVSGEQHRHDRKLLGRLFTASAVRAHGEVIAEVAEATAASWPRNRPFSMIQATRAMSLEITVRVIFGIHQPAHVRATSAATLALINAIHPILFRAAFLQRPLGGIGPWARSQRAQRVLDELLVEEMQRRTARGDEADDVMGLLLSARERDGAPLARSTILDQLRGLLFAGHDATAMATAWAFVWLHRQPAQLERLRAEIDALGPDPTPDALSSLPFLDAVCQEVLRLTPPVTDVARVVCRPFAVAGYQIPIGEAVRPTIPLVHSRQDLFPRPECFRPERFMESRFGPFEHIPFGAGPRRCLGAAFAMYEMKIVVATVLRRYRLRLAGGKPIRYGRRSLTMGPTGDVSMLVEEQRTRPRRRRAVTPADRGASCMS